VIGFVRRRWRGAVGFLLILVAVRSFPDAAAPWGVMVCSIALLGGLDLFVRQALSDWEAGP